MKNQGSYLFTLNTANITAVVNGVVRTESVKRSSVEFNEVVAALKRGDFDAAFAAFDKAEAIRRRSKGEFQVVSGIVYGKDGMPIHNVITSRILDFANSALPFEPLVLFLEKLNANPSKRAVDELYKFLENQNLPITVDGCFFAYKSVSSDWKSKASGREDVEVSTDGGKTWEVFKGRIPNRVGSIVRMTRNLVDDDKDRTCSNGLHVGALAYAGHGGWYNSPSDHVVLVKVNPMNAVSVPSDHQAQKLRVCEYEVVAECTGALDSALVETNATPFSKSEAVTFRCRKCRKRKKASTFAGQTGKRQKCPRCGSRNTKRL
jgi:hypothetical protein